MEKTFATPITSVSTHTTKFDVVALGYMDGLVRCCIFDVDKKKLQSVWSSRFKRSIRGLEYSDDGAFLYVICANRAVCIYDVESGKRLRCIKRCHDQKPSSIYVLPTADEVVTGSEEGEIRIWDFRQDVPVVATFKEQDDIVNAFGVYKNSLLSVNGDCTLGTYDFRQKKLRLKSETMHSELLSIAIGDRLTYVGASDGHIEVFKNGEYGNILERIETPFSMGVDALILLRSQLLLAGSAMDDEMRFFHLSPNKQLHSLEQFGGADILTKTKDSKFLVSVSCDSSSFRLRRLPDLIDKIPFLKAQDVHELKKRSRKANVQNEAVMHDFFKDLIENDNQTNKDDSINSDDEDGIEQEDMETRKVHSSEQDEDSDAE